MDRVRGGEKEGEWGVSVWRERQEGGGGGGEGRGSGKSHHVGLPVPEPPSLSWHSLEQPQPPVWPPLPPPSVPWPPPHLAWSPVCRPNTYYVLLCTTKVPLLRYCVFAKNIPRICLWYVAL